MNHRLRALLLSLLLVPATVLAQQTAERSADYTVETGDRWIDAQLQDINHYAERYPDAFLDEVSRYADVPAATSMRCSPPMAGRPGISISPVSGPRPADRPAATACAPSARTRRGWEAVVKRMPTRPENLHYRAVRHAIVASYRHWDRPITLDATLKRQLKR